MKLKNVIQTKLAKTLVAALLIGSVSNTGFTSFYAFRRRLVSLGDEGTGLQEDLPAGCE